MISKLSVSMDAGKYLKTLNILIVIGGGISVIAAAYTFYRSNLWKPKIEVIKIDYKKGEADVVINGKQKKLYGNSTLAASGTWGVRFNSDTWGGKYNRVEIVKDDNVYDYIY